MNFYSSLFKWLILLCCLACLPLKALAEPVSVALLPFVVHADQDYGFVQKGVVEMLASRISAPGKVVVVDPVATSRAVAQAADLTGDNLALRVGGELDADLVIHGSITVLGESVSIDAKLLDMTGSRAPTTFFKQARGMGDVIPQVNQMAADINAQVFGVRLSSSEIVPAAVPPQPAPTTDRYRHPERLIQESRVTSPVSRMPGSPTGEPGGQPHALNPAFTTTAGGYSGSDPGFWKSRNYNHLINGIAVGDVVDDGLLETVVATPEKIFIYRFAHGQQQTVAEIDSGRYVRNIGVDIADINGNGRPEIFVTALSISMTALESYVLEFDGQAFRTVSEKNRYYYRVAHHPTMGVMLLGQRQISTQATPIEAPVFEMEWNGADYVTGRRLLPGRMANLLGLDYGDILNDGGENVVAYDPNDHLRVLSTTGKIHWTGSSAFGGTPLYFALPPAGPDESYVPFYYPNRIRIADLEGDGKHEVIVARNEEGTGRRLARQRLYRQGAIEALVWDGLGLTSAWRTRQFSGRIQDFLVADFNNDGIPNLLAALVTKEGAIVFTDPQSVLIAFELSAAP